MSTQLREQPRSIVQGEAKSFILTFTSPDLVTTANPQGRVDLTGTTVRYCVKEDPGDETAIIDKTSDIPTEILILTQSGTTLGRARVFFVPTDTSVHDPGDYFYDAWAILPGDERHATLLPSPFRIIDGVCDIDSVPPPPGVGAASQGPQFRTFQFPIPSTGVGPFTVPMGAMFDGTYVVSVMGNLPLPGGGTWSEPLVGSKTPTSFDLTFIGPVTIGTLLDVWVRDF